VTEAPEETCDDGNRTPGDGCSDSCTLEARVVAAGYEFTCAVGPSGIAKCWGTASYPYGNPDPAGDGPGEMGENLSTLDFGNGRRVQSIVAGTWHACGLLDDGSVKCWGRNFGGVLGQGDGRHPSAERLSELAPVALGTGRRATSLAAGHEHTCAVLDDGSVKCWGKNSDGTLGLGDAEDRGDEPGEMGDDLPAVNLGTGYHATSIAASSFSWTTCALLNDGTVKCWGHLGPLGLGTTESRGRTPSEMGDNLPAVDLGTGRRATAISAGPRHVCALLYDASVKCWGDNGDGRLGLGDTENRGDDPNEMGDNLLAVDLGVGRYATSIHAGGGHTCALLDDGSIKCWGASELGSLGLGDMETRGDEPGEMGDNLPAIDFGPSGRVRTMSAGDGHNCAVLGAGALKCWGRNDYGQLGLGDTENRGDEPGEMGDALPAVDLAF
jgi:cysteine-rich repeat protein